MRLDRRLPDMLKRIEFAITAAMTLLKIRLARGARFSRWRGMMGLWTQDSTQRKRGNETMNMMSEAITKGCDPGGY
jgi:hypothetical protein